MGVKLKFGKHLSPEQAFLKDLQKFMAAYNKEATKALARMEELKEKGTTGYEAYQQMIAEGYEKFASKGYCRGVTAFIDRITVLAIKHKPEIPVDKSGDKPLAPHIPMTLSEEDADWMQDVVGASIKVPVGMPGAVNMK